MERVDKLGRMLKWRCKWMLEDFLHSEKGAVDIVAIVIMIGIAVLVALAFKKQIIKLVNDLFENVINPGAENAIICQD